MPSGRVKLMVMCQNMPISSARSFFHHSPKMVSCRLFRFSLRPTPSALQYHDNVLPVSTIYIKCNAI